MPGVVARITEDEAMQGMMAGHASRCRAGQENFVAAAGYAVAMP